VGKAKRAHQYKHGIEFGGHGAKMRLCSPYVLKESALGQLPNLPGRLKAMVGNDQKTMLGLYRIIGRRPAARRLAAEQASQRL